MYKLAQNVLLTCVVLCGSAQAQVTSSPTRGELLYNTHCIQCHTTQMHWRGQRQARDWPSLLANVQRWQSNAALQWSDEDITAVASHLNGTIYRYPQPGERVSAAGVFINKSQ